MDGIDHLINIRVDIDKALTKEIAEMKRRTKGILWELVVGPIVFIGLVQLFILYLYAVVLASIFLRPGPAREWLREYPRQVFPPR